MTRQKLDINISDQGQRLDHFLQSKLQESRSQIKREIVDGRILVNKSRVKAGYILKEGDQISIQAKEDDKLIAKDLKLTLVYEDNYLAVIDKKAGLVVHPGAGREEESLVHGLLYEFTELAQGSGPQRPGIVHRLDKDTSGLMVIAKKDESYEKLVELFKHHKVEKEYMCIVHGNVEAPGHINKPIGRSHRNRKSMAVDVHPAKEALTDFWPVQDLNGYTLVRVVIQTGRTHQIRVHMSSIGHSIVGDRLYGPKTPRAARQLLHSCRLAFQHPVSGRELEFKSSLPGDFLTFIREQGGGNAANT